MNTVTSADGTAIAYDRAGTGESLVLVGGALATAATQDRSSWPNCCPRGSPSTAMTAEVAVTAVTAPGTP